MKQLRPHWNKANPKQSFTGHENKNKELYQSRIWKQIRQQVIRRDKGICQMCNKPYELGGKSAQIDHIKPVNQGGAELDLCNLQLLCFSCHASKSGKERVKLI